MRMKNFGMIINDSCRICGSNALYQIFDFGEQPLANAFLRKEDLVKPEITYPLRVFLCSSCNLVQLIDVVDPNVLFSNYVYYSSGMPSSPHFQAYADEVITRFLGERKEKKFVVEIGSNDGHLLSLIQRCGAHTLGIDPARNIVDLAQSRGVHTLSEFFSMSTAEDIADAFGMADVIIANNVVAHINDLHDLFRGVRRLLHADGVFIFEVPYLLDMFDNLTFDTIYHEHLSYFALQPLMRLLHMFEMEMIDVKIVPVQGNSIRVYAAREKHWIATTAPHQFFFRERQQGLHLPISYFSLRHSIRVLRDSVRKLIYALRSEGKRIAAYGAPAKGNTLLNFYALGSDVIEFVTEALPSKIGLFTPGMHIPVVDIAWARENPPDYYLLLAWNYKDVILKNEQEFLARGGKFIIPVGYERIIPA